MDLLTHAMYGATVCSRTGLAGGQKGSGRRFWFSDPTVWWAILFSLGPDMVSMWIPFALHGLSGQGGNPFYLFGGAWLTVYRFAHSLVTAAVISAGVLALKRSLFVPSLAWTLHILIDAVSHGSGKFHTLPFYPFSNWGFKGMNWWENPWLLKAAWTILPAIWLALVLWRRGAGIGRSIATSSEASRKILGDDHA